MFIKELTIKNFKCFDSKGVTLDFNTPDGKTKGSGLNIFVGENNTGKSTVFEAVDFLRDYKSGYAADVHNGTADADNKEIKVAALLHRRDDRGLYVAPRYGSGSRYPHLGEIQKYVFQKRETTKQEAYLEEAGLERVAEVGPCLEFYRSANKQGASDLYFSTGGGRDAEYVLDNGADASIKRLLTTSFVWAETNPAEQSRRLLALIHQNVVESVQKPSVETEAKNASIPALSKEIKRIEQRIKDILFAQFKFNNVNVTLHTDIGTTSQELERDVADVKDRRVLFDFHNTKIEIDDGAVTYMDKKGSGLQRAVTLALFQVYAEQLMRQPKGHEVENSYLLFLDEPEICLHPQAQKQLLSAILKMTKTRQVFLATHSPYFFQNPACKNAGIFLFKKDASDKINIEQANVRSWGLFPWSPSWGEICYHAYKLPTIEFHNELYGHLQKLSKRQNFSGFSGFDGWLQEQGISDKKEYHNQKSGKTETVTLCTYIRHRIHHPENGKKGQYTDAELRKSIGLMIKLIEDKFRR